MNVNTDTMTINQTIKGYDLRDRIGAGGFGAVYRAYQSTVGREVAIKFILPGFANQPEFIRRFEAEAQLVARLEHPHITPLYDYWRDPDGAYLVMRYIRGGTLHSALQTGPYELRPAALLLDQIAGALSLAHRNGVIHRDIKPGNILLDEDGNAYLTDFGIAKDLNLPTSHTQQDAIVGSLDYISPEQARGEPVTPRTDIYSLGVTLFEVITGHHPFENISPIERLYKHINDPLPDITSLDPALLDGINRVIQKATAKNPEKRYPDALAFAADFREAIGLNRASTTIVELLTIREQEILQLIIEGLSNKEIAQRLTVTVGTVKWYVNQIYGKLGVRSRVQAIVRARELSLIVKPGEALEPVTIPTEDFRPENPYKGLRAFQPADYQDFYGREKVTAKLVKRLGENGEHHRFLAVIGPSGSGKSSLVKAGVIPALWRGELPESEKWFVVEMMPGSRPLDELEIALTKIAANQAGNLREQLGRDKFGLARVANLILPDDGSELVLVIDQFEEVFTLLENEVARVHFLDLLYAAATEPRSRVRVIVTLRADFYDRPLHYPQFGELVRTRLETIMPLSAEELESAIARPAERVGVSFEPGLVAGIIGDVNYQPGALPLLQYALTELFEGRSGHFLTREAYQAIGGTVGALAKRAEEVYEGLDEAGRETVRQLFLRLVTLGEGAEDTRRRAARSELLAIANDEAHADMVDEVIDTFAAYRLLSLDIDPGTRSPTVEVAHEALLREWERLRLWLNDSRDEIKLQRQLAAMAEEWHTAKQDTSFLAHGSRLDQFETWVGQTGLALTARERGYLDASITERERQAAAETARQAQVKTLERRAVDRLRALVAVMFVALIGAVGLIGVALNQSQVAQRNAAETQNVALVAGSRAALANGDTAQALALALQAVTLDPVSAPAQVALGQAAYAPGTVRQFAEHTGHIWGADMSPDGKMALSGGDDLMLILWDLETGRMIRRFSEGHTDGHIRVDFSPDGHEAISGADDGLVILWDITTGQIIRRFEGHSGHVSDVQFSPDGKTALSSGQDNTLILWNLTTGAVIRRFTGHTASVQSVVFSTDGSTALSGSSDKTLILWNVATGELLQQIGDDVDTASVDLSLDGHYAVSAGTIITELSLWDMTTGEFIRQFTGHTAPVHAVRFSPDGQHIASAAEDGAIIVWDTETGQIITRLVGHTGGVNAVAFSPDGRYILSGSADTTLLLWDLEAGYLLRHLPGHAGWVNSMHISADGRTALTASWAGTAILWDLQTGQELRRLTGPIAMNSSAYSPDGRTAVVAEGNGQGFTTDTSGGIILWDLDTGETLQHFITNQPVIGLDYRPDGRSFIAGMSDGSVLQWDIASGEIIRRFGAHPLTVVTVTFSADGRTVLTGAVDGSLILWDVETGQPIRHFVGQTDLVAHIVFSKDGSTVLTPGPINGTNMWDVASGRLIRHFEGGTVFSPDEQVLFGYGNSTLRGNSAVLVDLGSGDLIRHFTGLQGFPIASRFMPDGQSVLVGYSDGKLEQWRIDATLDELLTWTHANRYIPQLTCEQRELYRLEPSCPTESE